MTPGSEITSLDPDLFKDLNEDGETVREKQKKIGFNEAEVYERDRTDKNDNTCRDYWKQKQ